MELIRDVRPPKKIKIKDSAFIDLPSGFEEALDLLKSRGYKLINLEESAQLRMQEKGYLPSGLVMEGSLYIPRKGRYITKNSAILADPKEAIRAHGQGREYSISDELVQRALESSVQIPWEIYEIPVEAFGEEEITSFCFGKSAKDYGLFLREEKVKKMPLDFYPEWQVQKKRKPYADQLFFSDFVYGCDEGSDILGRWADLHRCSQDELTLRGVKK